MSKSKVRPSSIRLTPADDAWISSWVKATGWTVSGVMRHAIAIAACMHVANPIAAETEMQRARLAEQLRRIDLAAEKKKRKLRTAERTAPK